MEIIEWWPKLDSITQAWLTEHNGESVSPETLKKIMDAGGTATSDEWWIGEAGAVGFYLSEEAIDWIEATASDESA